ncbi:T9SS type A sorting domain-containing protein [Patiriisocius hiemis]|uniref:T9SS type A sorting domain-containing protein n=1 Tax=Patiriisocius hiemis TaxID=3075604 RepID=A0ABU2YBI5_9FLAO|nr:T9SS type A sorting domain-containing protein [Constantimarinum sp. W242]MDT0554413.1 T9SS type A sorting domain-containing protein [Constantimarinum sp. W242]
MRKITLLFMAILSAAQLSAQTTFELDWEQGVMGAAASFTIEQGDTVLWTWSNGAPHSVTSLAGSVEDFDSSIITGEGTEFMYTFTVLGENPYQCDVHPNNMFGTITVEEILSVQDKFEQNINFYPNPVEDKLIIESLYKFDTYEIFNLQGKKVGQGLGEGTYTHLETSYLTTGMYFVRIVADDLTATIKINKK